MIAGPGAFVLCLAMAIYGVAFVLGLTRLPPDVACGERFSYSPREASRSGSVPDLIQSRSMDLIRSRFHVKRKGRP